MSPFPPGPAILLGIAALAAAAAPHALPAQRGSATLVATLVDRTSRTPLTGARVAVLGAAAVVHSDSTGQFRRTGLRPGAYLLQVRAVGYRPADWSLELSAGQTLEVVLEMDLLPIDVTGVVVTGAAPPADRRLAEFEQRRRSGRGYFVTESDIQRRGATKLSDLLRNIPGVGIVCRGRACRARMDRTPRGCAPDFFVDGFLATNSTSLDMTVWGVVGVEVYRTLSETPLQFLNAGNLCGTIVIWTRAGPSSSSPSP